MKRSNFIFSAGTAAVAATATVPALKIKFLLLIRLKFD